LKEASILSRSIPIIIICAVLALYKS